MVLGLQPTLQCSFHAPILCLLPCLGRGSAEVPIKMLKGHVAVLLPSFVSILADKQPCGLSDIPASSMFSQLFSICVLCFPPEFSLGSFPDLQPHPSSISRISAVPHAHSVWEWGLCSLGDGVRGADLHCQPRNASQGNITIIITIIIAACRSAGAARAICAFKGHSSAAEIHPRIYVRLAGLYKLPLKVDFFISHFLLHKMFITVVSLPVFFLTAFSIPILGNSPLPLPAAPLPPTSPHLLMLKKAL